VVIFLFIKSKYEKTKFSLNVIVKLWQGKVEGDENELSESYKNIP